MKRIIPYICLMMMAASAATGEIHAQEKLANGLEIDKTVHNFGDILLKSGPVSCTFTLRNQGQKAAVIYNVATTCGCTDVKWTKEPIRPGQSGTISVTYSNDEGPYPFDKTLTVYLSDLKKPVLLKIRGVSLAEKKPLSELYPVSYGPLAMRESVNRCGNVEQGEQKSEAILVANLSDSPISVSFTEVSDQLSLSLSPNPIPAGSTAELSFTVTADREIWGKHTYYAVPVINGRTYNNSESDNRIGFWAFTKENFSRMTEEEKARGSRPVFTNSTYSFGKIRKGETVHAEYTFRNDGKEWFCVHKVDADACCWSHSTIPAAAPGKEVTFRVHLDTRHLPAGEHLTIVTLTTNSPLRPIVNLFIAGYIE